MSKRKKICLLALIIVFLPIAVYFLLPTEGRVNWEFGTEFDNSIEIHYFLAGPGRFYNMIGKSKDDVFPSRAGGVIERHELINFFNQLKLLYANREYCENIKHTLNSMANNTFKENEFSFYGYTNDKKRGSTLNVFIRKNGKRYSVFIANGFD